MITPSGPICDVCGHYILLEGVNFFTVKGIEKDLLCDDKCKKAVLDAGNEWEKLPEGPLKREFQRVSEEMKGNS